jgi:hypothetical protein
MLVSCSIPVMPAAVRLLGGLTSMVSVAFCTDWDRR